MFQLGVFDGVFEILLYRGIIGIYDDYAAVAVDDNGVAGIDAFGNILQRDYRRDTQRPCDNRGMACSAAGACGDAFDIFFIETRRLRGA